MWSKNRRRDFACESKCIGSVFFSPSFLLYWPFISDTVRTLTVQRMACMVRDKFSSHTSNHQFKVGERAVDVSDDDAELWCRRFDGRCDHFQSTHRSIVRWIITCMCKRSGQMQCQPVNVSCNVPNCMLKMISWFAIDSYLPLFLIISYNKQSFMSLALDEVYLFQINASWNFQQIS